MFEHLVKYKYNGFSNIHISLTGSNRKAMNKKKKMEFGDFQTPMELCDIITKNTKNNFNYYNYYIEPTCGLGNFLLSLNQNGVHEKKLLGWEFNENYVETANSKFKINDVVKKQDFFKIDFQKLKEEIIGPVFFIGNPPWITNSALSKLKSKNTPDKLKIENLKGIEAITGKSNFDISEYMLRKIIDFIDNTNSSLAFLIKTSVARKLFSFIATQEKKIKSISIKKIDANKYFGVSVDACLFEASGTLKKVNDYTCKIYDDLKSSNYKTLSFKNKKLIADIFKYNELISIDSGCEYNWRSGIKHDCSKVMELNFDGERFTNGYDEYVDIEPDYLYPMYKSSNIAKKELKDPTKYMIVPQSRVGENTDVIKEKAPLTWKYLNTYGLEFARRKSAIYKNKPEFSIFGVGEYTFKPWKVAISGLYKNFKFSLIGPYNGKSVVFDDTCYFIGFDSKDAATASHELLSSTLCSEFLSTVVFKDNKRPITVNLLNRINLASLERHINKRAT